MKYGVTGTRDGMTPAQQNTFLQFLIDCDDMEEFHHGDCIGVDADTAAVVLQNKPMCKIMCHPPTNNKRRAYASSHVIYPEKDYLIRDQDIVDAVDFLLVVPKEPTEQQRSGTWSTYRKGLKKHGLHIVIIKPDGTVTMPKPLKYYNCTEYDYKYWLQEIDNLIKTCQWAFDTLDGIKTWVQAHEFITDAQVKALLNIQNASQRGRE